MFDRGVGQIDHDHPTVRRADGRLHIQPVTAEVRGADPAGLAHDHRDKLNLPGPTPGVQIRDPQVNARGAGPVAHQHPAAVLGGSGERTPGRLQGRELLVAVPRVLVEETGVLLTE